MSITYSPSNRLPIGVYRNNEHIGAIHRHGVGYRFQLKGANYYGDSFNTIREVKRSLGDDI